MDAIYFDLDGTLTDPKPGITRSIQYALQRLDHPTMPTEDELTWCIGPPLRTSFVRLLGGETSADLAVSLYRERFSDVGLYENGVYDGIGDVLTTLCASGHRLFVATSKAHVFADRIIDHFGLRDHFEHVFGAELDGTRVDKSRSARIRAEASVRRSRQNPDDRRPQPRHGRCEEQRHEGHRRVVRLWQPGRVAGGRRAPCLRDAGRDPGLHFVKRAGTFARRLKFEQRR